MYFILAPSFSLAQFYCEKHAIRARDWRLVRDTQDLLQLSKSQEVLYLYKDRAGFFDFPLNMYELIQHARDLETMKRIKLRPISMEKSP